MHHRCFPGIGCYVSGTGACYESQGIAGASAGGAGYKWLPCKTQCTHSHGESTTSVAPTMQVSKTGLYCTRLNNTGLYCTSTRYVSLGPDIIVLGRQTTHALSLPNHEPNLPVRVVM